MNVLAWLVGRAATQYARVMLRWAETTHGKHAVRLWVYSNVLDASDEPALIGIAGKRRGSRITAPGTAERYDVWRHCVACWMFTRLAEESRITIDGWTSAQPDAQPATQNVRIAS